MTTQTNTLPPSNLTYVLVTPARNEEAYIEQTLKSVVTQTLKPLRWIVVSDGSTDRTDEIVSRYVQAHPWIELVRTPERKERHFAGKVHAFNAGYARLKEIDYDIIGNLDADIAFESNYFSFLLGKFGENPKLGVGGTPFREGADQYDYRFASIEHVSGACQLFRRECFEAIGGYTPLKMGGIDLVAVTTARMMGWQTRSFIEKTCQHNKKTQIENKNQIRAYWKTGYKNFLLGNAFAWQVLRAFYHMVKPPFVIGGLALLGGYLWAVIKRSDPSVSEDLMIFRKKEQIVRLKEIIARMVPNRKI